MADFTISATLGAQTASFTISPGDTRFTEFLDDLRNLHYPPKDNGNVLTRAEAAVKWINDLGAGQVQFAKGLKQRRLNSEVSEADDLQGNV